MWCKILLLALFCQLGHSVQIISTGRTVNVDTQQTQEIKMDCEVSFSQGESLLKNLVYWFKIQNLTILDTFTSEEIVSTKLNNQDTQISEEMEMAIDSTVQISSLLQAKNPFDDDNKFIVANKPSSSNEVISLTVKRLEPTDSGRYICAVAGNQRVKTMDMSLNILQRVTTVSMHGAPEVPDIINRTDMNMNQDSTALVYHDDKDGYFECKSEGGYPAPQLKVYIGERSISGSQGLNQADTNYTLMGDLGGRQTIVPIRWVNSTRFRVNKDMNNQKIRCQAEIRTTDDGTFQNKTAEKTLIVYYKPFIDCKEKEIKIPLGRTAIPVKCDIHARPTPEITWTAKKNNVKVASNDNTQNSLGLKATTEVTTSDDNMIATLTFDEVRSEHFQEYEIVAENVVGSSYIRVTIKDGELKVEAVNDSASSLSSMALLIAVAALIQLVWCIS